MTYPLTTRQVAERWQVCEKTVRTIINAGRLRHFRLGGKLLRIPVDAVEEFECQNTSLVSSEAPMSPSISTEPDDVIAMRLVRLMHAKPHAGSTSS